MTLFAQDNPAQTAKKISVTRNEASQPLNETNGSQNSAKITAKKPNIQCRRDRRLPGMKPGLRGGSTLAAYARLVAPLSGAELARVTSTTITLVRRIRRACVAPVALFLLPFLLVACSASQARPGTVTGYLALAGGPPGACSLRHPCYSKGTISFTGKQTYRFHTDTGRFRLQLAPGIYHVAGGPPGAPGACETTSIVVRTSKTDTVHLWCQIP